MEFRPRLPENGINVSRTHPLREALVLGGGLLALGAVLVVLGAVVVDLAVPHIPPRWEARVFGGLWDSSEESLDEDQAQRIATLQSLLDRLASHWPDRPFEFRVRILEESSPNALAFPGGMIGVTEGLLEQVESENELAFVLAHEIGHFRERHHLRSLGRGLVLVLVVSMLSGGSAGSSSGLLSLGPALASHSFDRDQEREADRFGLDLVYREYGHVASAWDFFERLKKLGGGPGEKLASYLSTHPVSAERIDALGALARESGWSTAGEPRPFPGSDALD